MKHNFALFAGVASVLLAASTCATANITYTVNETILNGSVTGTITTDGMTGLLTGADIVAWNLLLKGGAASTTLTDMNSVVLDYGTNGFFGVPSNDVTATATDLFFNYSGADAGYLAFQTPPAYGGQMYWCNATHNQGFDCAVGESVVPVLFSDPSSQYDTSRTGNQIIGVAGTSAVPEPMAWMMMLVGFAGVGAVMRRRGAGASIA
jgi:hypothetical protein